MSAETPLTISALRACFSRFNDEDPIEKVWQDGNGQMLLKQVSLLVRREENKGGQAALSPRYRALKASTSTTRIEPPSDEEMVSWSQCHASFWTICLNFDGRQQLNMIFEALDTRLRMIAHLDILNRSLRVRKRFLCLFFYDFAKIVHPNAERLGAAAIRSVVAQLRLCGLQAVDTDQLKASIATGRRLDELSRIAGAGATFCLPEAADHGTRLEQLGELVPDLAQWLIDTGLEEWKTQHDADSLGNDARRMIIESAFPATSLCPTVEHCAPVTDLDFMFTR